MSQLPSPDEPREGCFWI